MRDLKLPSLSDGLVDGLGVALDTAMEIAQVVPVVGKALQLAQSIRSTADALFIRKVARFLQELANTSKEDCEHFLTELDAADKREQFQESLLLLLDKMDQSEKATVVGRLYRAAIQNQISLADAQRLSSIVNRTFYNDLIYLTEFEDETIGSDPDIAIGLRSNGLLQVTQEDYGTLDDPTSGGIYYTLNSYGEKLLRYGLREHST